MITDTETKTDNDPFAGYAPEEDKPLASYGVLMSVFLTLASSFGVWFRRSGRTLPERMDGRDLLLLTVASHNSYHIGEFAILRQVLGTWPADHE